jgi:hypothetical protein
MPPDFTPISRGDRGVAVQCGRDPVLRQIGLRGRQDEHRGKLAPGHIEADQLGCASGRPRHL